MEVAVYNDQKTWWRKKTFVASERKHRRYTSSSVYWDNIYMMIEETVFMVSLWIYQPSWDFPGFADKMPQIHQQSRSQYWFFFPLSEYSFRQFYCQALTFYLQEEWERGNLKTQSELHRRIFALPFPLVNLKKLRHIVFEIINYQICVVLCIVKHNLFILIEMYWRLCYFEVSDIINWMLFIL